MGKKKEKKYLSTEDFMRTWKAAEHIEAWNIFAACIRQAHRDAELDEPSDTQINMRCVRINSQVKKAGYEWRYRKPKMIRRENMTIAQILQRCEELHGDYIPKPNSTSEERNRSIHPS